MPHLKHLLPALLLSLPALANAAPPAPAAPPVTLSQNATTLTLDNGILSLTIDKSNGNVNQITYNHHHLLERPAYFDTVQSAADPNPDVDPGKDQTKTRRAPGQFTIVTSPDTNHGQLAELSFRRVQSRKSPEFNTDFHIVLRRGDSGFYAFALFSHPADYLTAHLAQSRMVFRPTPHLFNTIAIDDQRLFPAPPPDTAVKHLGPKESMLVTEGPFKGQIFDKYLDFVDAGDHYVHGWIGADSHLGCFIVDGSTEDHNGGPTKQHNTAHFPQILLKILTCCHYGAAPVTLTHGQAWQKLYGPWMFYVNAVPASTPDPVHALWQDAKDKAAQLRAQWPYDWMNNPAYPLAADRGAVAGTLHISDPQDPSASPANAWVGLAAPSPDWQQQSNGYQYWVHADSDGRFRIPNVRPGTYTLYAFTNGVMDQFRRDDVSVQKSHTTDLHTLDWTPVRHGTQLWQIGIPDRTAKEFRHGDDYRHWGLPALYTREFPNDVDFTIGKSNPRTDWNYAQPNVLRDGKWTGPTWTIHFNVPDNALHPGDATLDLAIAAANHASLLLAVNGHSAGHTPPLPHDNAMIRESIHGQYRLLTLPFPTSLLRPGPNQLTLTLHAPPGNLKFIMYDALRLELP